MQVDGIRQLGLCADDNYVADKARFDLVTGEQVAASVRIPSREVLASLR